VLENGANKNEWLTSATAVNGFYYPPRNEIVLPAAIMQSPVLDIDTPAYLSYGALGAILGHELSHAFDPNGKLYDQDERYHNWWTNATAHGFQERADCFVDQYSKLTILNGTRNVNGKQTQAENIADAGGLNTAFVAWSRHREVYPDLNLPGLDFFTQEQLFFISYGRTFCAKQSEAYTRQVAAKGAHTPTAATRIMGTVANSRAFKKSFNCKQKEPVCELW
jgi:endothelin-converting enzyme